MFKGYLTFGIKSKQFIYNLIVDIIKSLDNYIIEDNK